LIPITGTGNSLSGYITNIANALIFLVGAVAVIMVIIGALKFVVSMGDAKRIENARNTIMYAIVGVVIAMCSFAIVNFVLGALNKSS
jgi:predicted membrane channel-forming protein YqfA (hemolysin III family)